MFEKWAARALVVCGFLTIAVGLRWSRAEAVTAPSCCGSPATYTARGVVKSRQADGKYLLIAHEKIEGYMAAMTMSFEPRRPEQLAAVKDGESVRFTFTTTEDGRRLLDSIASE
ncbi:MAG: copper-binding protein [Polyangiaceae bacterium]|nr:copper-binding protein [Polyangiaceae bacterium]